MRYDVNGMGNKTEVFCASSQNQSLTSLLLSFRRSNRFLIGFPEKCTPLTRN